MVISVKSGGVVAFLNKSDAFLLPIFRLFPLLQLPLSLLQQ